MASVTRNPAVLRLMAKFFRIVSPDLDDPDPFHHLKDDKLVQHLTKVYGRHVGADPAHLPMVVGRYTGGLYGGADPGKNIKQLPAIARHPENGMVMIALDRRYTV